MVESSKVIKDTIIVSDSIAFETPPKLRPVHQLFDEQPVSPEPLLIKDEPDISDMNNDDSVIEEVVAQ